MTDNTIPGLAAFYARSPRTWRRFERIVLLSHMRANTSLIGHILGDHPQINGYYELHIGYYSWRSFLRQKARYFARHDPKPDSRFLFDKVLHNAHGVDLSLFRGAKVVFSLRPPERTVPSVVSLYRGSRPGDPCATIDGAASYYEDRLRGLQELAAKSQSPYAFIDADAIRTNPEASLVALTSFLDLSTPLRTEYESQPLTGSPRAGDSSAEIHSGEIKQLQDKYADIIMERSLVAHLNNVYAEARDAIISNPNCTVVVADGEPSAISIQ